MSQSVRAFVGLVTGRNGIRENGPSERASLGELGALGANLPAESLAKEEIDHRDTENTGDSSRRSVPQPLCPLCLCGYPDGMTFGTPSKKVALRAQGSVGDLEIAVPKDAAGPCSDSLIGRAPT